MFSERQLRLAALDIDDPQWIRRSSKDARVYVSDLRKQNDRDNEVAQKRVSQRQVQPGATGYELFPTWRDL